MQHNRQACTELRGCRREVLVCYIGSMSPQASFLDRIVQGRGPGHLRTTRSGIYVVIYEIFESLQDSTVIPAGFIPRPGLHPCIHDFVTG